ncbi:hypothetical protein D1872_171090 [compost metagenome]
MTYFDNQEGRTLLHQLLELVPQSNVIKIVCGYVSEGGIKLIQGVLNDFVRRE